MSESVHMHSEVPAEGLVQFTPIKIRGTTMGNTGKWIAPAWLMILLGMIDWTIISILYFFTPKISSGARDQKTFPELIFIMYLTTFRASFALSRFAISVNPNRSNPLSFHNLSWVFSCVTITICLYTMDSFIGGLVITSCSTYGYMQRGSLYFW